MAQHGRRAKYFDVEIVGRRMLTSRPMKDRVDFTLAQWRLERPDLDLSHIGIVLRILLLGKAIEHHAARSLECLCLHPWELDVLGALRRQGPPYSLSAGELARRVVLTSSAMTHRITKLEQRGLVKRVTSAKDRRSVLVRLTDAGRRLADAGIEHRVREGAVLVDGLDAADREQLEELLRKLLASMDVDLSPICAMRGGEDSAAEPG